MMTVVDLKINQISREEALFPVSLRKIRPAVKSLFYKGEWDSSIFTNSLAVVGSRRMTTYGERVLEKLIPPLVEEKVSIISGGMYGVDITAHKLCMDCGGRTVAVLGWGIASEDDTEVYRLSQRFVDTHGLIISEYDGDRKSQLWMFPYRNRIIVGLCKAVLVIEAAQKSGSMVTVDWAEKFQVPLLAVPGPITSVVSEGTNSLIKAGLATAVCTPEDVLGALEIVSKKSSSQSTLKQETDPIMQALSLEERSVDELATFLHRSVSEVASEISMLELVGKVKQRAGKYYIK